MASPQISQMAAFSCIQEASAGSGPAIESGARGPQGRGPHLRYPLLQLAQPHVEVVRLIPVASAQGIVQLTPHLIELAFAGHTWMAKLFGLLAVQTLVGYAFLECLVHLLR